MKPSLSLHENPRVGSSELANLSAQLRGWRHVLRDFGGCFDGSGTYWQPDEKGQDPLTTEEQAWQMFYNGLGRRIKAHLNDWEVYDGEIVRMTMTKDGITRVRDLNLLANSVKGIYTRFGSNVITNPGAEIGTTSGETPAKTTWTGGNSYRHVYGDGAGNPDHPFPDVEFRTAWKSRGTTSFWCDASPCTFEGFEYGGGIKLTSTTAALASTLYALRFTINVTALTSGHQIRWAVADGTQELGSGLVIASGPGLLTFNTTFTSPSSVSGNLELVIYSYYDISAVFYVDDVRLCVGGSQVETEIYSNANSTSRYGTHHVEFVFGGMDDDEADRRIQLRLAEYAWPRTEFPEDVGGGGQQDGLVIETMGYIDQARWAPVDEGGVDTVSVHIASLIGQCELLSTGLVATNAENVYVEELDSERVFDALQKLVQSGGASNVRYSAGVWQNLKFDYYASDTTPRYARQGGLWRHVGGPPVEPCLMRPGLARDDDMLDEPYQGRDPRWMYLEEIEYDRDSDTVRCRRALDERNRLGSKPSAHDAATAATIIGMRGTVDMTLIAPSQVHNILSATYHGDAATGAVVRGDLLYGNATPKIARLALGGAAGSFVRRDATDVMWSTLTMPNAATVGDILYATGANAIGNLADVAAGSVLVSGGVGVAPAYSVSPTLTGLTLSGLTASTLIYSNASKAITSLANAAGYLYNDGAGALSWAATAAPTAHRLLSDAHDDTVAGEVARGSLIYGNATSAWDSLPLGGAAGSVLTRNASDVLWSIFYLAGTALQTYTFPALSGTVALGAGTLTVSTSNDVTITAHTHAITSSSNPGVNARILASDASGYLQLVRLGVNVAASSDKFIYAGDATLDTTATFYGVYCLVSKTAGVTDESDYLYGGYLYAAFNQVGGVFGSLYGGYVRALVAVGTLGVDGGTLAQSRHMFGIESSAGQSGGVITGSVYGGSHEVYLTSGDACKTAGNYVYGTYSLVDQEAAHTVHGTIYGHYVYIDADGTVDGSVYMLYLDEGSNIDYGIYQNGSAPNRFGGNVTLAASTFLTALTDGSGGGLRAGTGSDVLWYRGGANLWQTPDSVMIDGVTILLGGSTLGLTVRSNGINTEEYNGADSITINYHGYQNGTTQFRNFNIYDGKENAVAVFTGSSKAAAFLGPFGCNGAAAQASYVVGGAATDLATVITLANNLRTMAINNGMAVNA